MSENNGWIKCSGRLTETFTGFDLLIRSRPVLVWGKYTKNEENKILGAQQVTLNHGVSGKETVKLGVRQ